MKFQNRGNRASCGVATLTALSFAVLSFAVPPQAVAQQAPPAQTLASQAQLEQIVVTSSRQGEQNIQDIPMAISASSRMRERGTSSTELASDGIIFVLYFFFSMFHSWRERTLPQKGQ